MPWEPNSISRGYFDANADTDFYLEKVEGVEPASAIQNCSCGWNRDKPHDNV